MFACMQASVASAAVSSPSALAARKPAAHRSEPRESLTRDMYALVSHLMRVSHVETFDLIAKLDMSFTQIKALCALDAETEERSVKALAESMGVSLPAMSRAVDGLYERGFVDRQEDRLDRRMKRVRLTDAGRAMTNSLTEGRLAGIQGFLTSLSDEEADTLARALELILERRPEIAELRPAKPARAQKPASTQGVRS
jgi:DNA-binding MarR family transcriptional regulator